MSTKKELLATARKLKIRGRHDMTKEQLQAAIVEVTKPAPVVTLPRAPKQSGRRGIVYRFVNRDLPPQKMSPQLVGLVKAAIALKETEFTLKELAEYAVDHHLMSTAQEPHKIAVFYAESLRHLCLEEVH